MTPIINIIGAGRLGQTVGHLLCQHKLVKVGHICNSSEASAARAVEFIGQGAFSPTISTLAPADIILISTPDDLISFASKELSTNPLLKKGSLVFHCSGSMTSDILSPLKEKGCLIGSVHPMRSFAKPELSVEHYEGTYCALEGDAEALAKLHELFTSIGSITFNIDKIKKGSYHAAGVFASNYIVTLAQQALACLEEAGVEHDLAMRLITNLMQSTTTNLAETLSPKQSITGPIKRGDTETLRMHLNSMTTQQQKNIYSTLGKATLELTDHNQEQSHIITAALAL